MILLNEIDLGKSFSKLKLSLKESEELVKDGQYYNYMNAYINLRNSADRHIKECIIDSGSIESADPNDLKDISF